MSDVWNIFGDHQFRRQGSDAAFEVWYYEKGDWLYRNAFKHDLDIVAFKNVLSDIWMAGWLASRQPSADPPREFWYGKFVDQQTLANVARYEFLRKNFIRILINKAGWRRKGRVVVQTFAERPGDGNAQALDEAIDREMASEAPGGANHV